MKTHIKKENHLATYACVSTLQQKTQTKKIKFNSILVVTQNKLKKKLN